MQKSGGNLGLSLTDLILLRALRSRGGLPVNELVRVSQRPFEYVKDVLIDLQRRMLVKHIDESFFLSERALAGCGKMMSFPHGTI